MPRRSRCLLPGVPCHIIQRGTDRRETFSSGDDRHTYIDLLRQNLEDAEVRILGYCLMTNHVHVIAVPEREDSMSVLMRRVHGRYAQYFNARTGRTGHLWQNRFFSGMLSPDHLWTTLAYVERNPLRAKIVRRAEDYPWSSATAHITGGDGSGLLDMDWWRKANRKNWQAWINRPLPDNDRTGEGKLNREPRACTFAGRPFGDEHFVDSMGMAFGRQWRGREGRPSKGSLSTREKMSQFSLFERPASDENSRGAV